MPLGLATAYAVYTHLTKNEVSRSDSLVSKQIKVTSVRVPAQLLVAKARVGPVVGRSLRLVEDKPWDP
jgi:hypothetical protein